MAVLLYSNGTTNGGPVSDLRLASRIKSLSLDHNETSLSESISKEDLMTSRSTSSFHSNEKNRSLVIIREDHENTGLKPALLPNQSKAEDKSITDYHIDIIKCWKFSYSQEQLERKREEISKIYSKKTFNFKLLPNYKNPCWYEPIDVKHTGDKNLLMLQNYASYSNDLKQLEKRWRSDYTAGRKTEKLRCLPYLYLAGMPKSGTTDMFYEMHLHPNISMSLAKEPHWWTKRAYGMGRTKYVIPFQHYVDIFDVAASQIEKARTGDYHPMITLEGSPSTAEFAEPWPLYPENRGLLEPAVTAANHIYNFTPRARILITLRNPTDRLYSHFMFETPVHNVRYGTPEGFHRCVLQGLREVKTCLETRSLRQCAYNWTVNYPARQSDQLTIKTGLYYVFINDWLKVFPREQLKVVRFEDYANDRGPVLKEIYKFLDVGPLPESREKVALKKRPSNTRSKKFRKKGDMLKSTRTLLNEFFKPYNKMLADLFNDDRFLWADHE